MTAERIAAPFPTVQGRCPACGWTSLFLGSGGYVTCARAECPQPDAASTLLERDPLTAPAAAVSRQRAADSTCLCGTSPDPGICTGGHCRCACNQTDTALEGREPTP